MWHPEITSGLDTPGQVKASVEHLENIDEIHIGDYVRREGAYGEGIQAKVFRGEY